MSPADSQNKKKADWVLTKEAFDKLLALFSADQDEAVEMYEAMRRTLQRTLQRFFQWKYLPNLDELVDVVISRVAQKIDEGENISNLNGYFRSVAKNVALEELRRIQLTLSLDDTPEPVDPDPDEDEDRERRLQCLDECLDSLQIESRTLIVKYYYYDDKNKIDNRKQLADSLGIPMNALRIRAFRLRSVLEECVEKCLDSSPGPK